MFLIKINISFSFFLGVSHYSSCILIVTTKGHLIHEKIELE